ncbi:glycoside hydrolase family 18 protein [Pedobacter sp. Du54]|uniref:glycoside hydrolase family 18 protein n=1 Tax=Pedobacter anseongensis TaxID=3133439 RepID=UPI003098FD47
MKKMLLFFILAFSSAVFAQKKPSYNIVAYYTGSSERLQHYPLEKLTHLIYSFVKLRHDTLLLRDSKQEQNVRQIVALKKKYPQLKIMVSIGGWGGCASCSDLFADANHRKTFAKTTVALLKKYNLDGLDLDWEYPAIEGFPGHTYTKADRDNFTALVSVLRNEMGNSYLLTFAAGGFLTYLEESVDWANVHPFVDFINLMTYDLVGGYAIVTGHHTPLYSYRKNQESTDKCVSWLVKHKVPAHKLITGAAIYGRVWEKVSAINNGLYQSGIFKQGVSFANFDTYFSDSSGFHYFWDKKAKAAYQYNPSKQLFATFDNEKSITAKAQYVKRRKLGGIMFWELSDDKPKNGLLEQMWKVLGSK